MGWNPLTSLGQGLGKLEQGLVDRAIENESAARRSGTARQAKYVKNLYRNNPEELIKVVADRTGLDAAAIRGDREAMDQRQFVMNYAPQMKRGIGGFGSLGPAERQAHHFANNKVIRRGVYPTLATGGTVAAGAGLTEGAQQLMALMSFMQQGQDQVQRTEESPLA